MSKSKISPEFIEKALGMYETYKSDKQSLNDRICENERWYRKWHEANNAGAYNSEENALTALRPILKGNMAHIASDGPEKSLTGPVERNDEETIQKHLQCLETAEDRQLYRLLSRRITGLAQHRHPERDYTEIRQLLRKDGSK